MSFRRGRGGLGSSGSRFSSVGARDVDPGANRPQNVARRDSGPTRLSNHTSDASMASARIFIGNLPTNDSRLTKDYLEERFSRYGHIMGISVLKGFGFIQYADEASAEDAIRDAQHSDIFGHRIDVKHAKSGKESNVGSSQVSETRDYGSFRERSPIRSREPDFPPRGRDQDAPLSRGRDPSLGRSGPREFGGRERDGNRGRDANPFADGEGAFLDGRDMHPGDPYASVMPTEPLRSFGAHLPPNQGPPMANEVEIIVTSKVGPVRQYAEQVESRLKSQGLAVDVLFPHEDIPLRKVLYDLSARGTLFGIVVTPLNQEQGSITLNILFGQPEEHRNMPVEDALCLLTTAFKRHKGLATGGGADRKIQIGMDAHPANLQHLINLLQENRPLTLIEYDRLIRYLSEKRDRQARLETGDDPGSGRLGAGHPAVSSLMSGGGGMLGAMSTPGLGGTLSGGVGSGAVGSKTGDPQAELQQRILSILNAGSVGGVAVPPLGAVGVPAPVPVPAPHPAGSSVSSLGWAGGGGAAEVSSTGQSQSLSDPTSAIHTSIDGLMQTGQPLLKHFGASLPSGAHNMGSANTRPIQQTNSNYNPNPYMNKRF